MADQSREEGVEPGVCAEHGGLMWSNAMTACITPDDVIRGGCRWQSFSVGGALDAFNAACAGVKLPDEDFDAL